jgi:hypothetical protein
MPHVVAQRRLKHVVVVAERCARARLCHALLVL